MDAKELDKWYCHLTVDAKERIVGCSYPECSRRWNALPIVQKEELYKMAGGREAHDHHKWKKGNSSLT